MFHKLQKLKELREQYEAKMKSEASIAVTEALKGFFAEFPDVLALRWEQYTPYFNDGDTCEFTFYELNALPKGDPSSMGDNEDGFIGAWSLSYAYRTNYKNEREYYEKIRDLFSKDTVVAIGELNDILSSSTDSLLFAFGDHAQVTVTPDSVEVDSYEHD